MGRLCIAKGLVGGSRENDISNFDKTAVLDSMLIQKKKHYNNKKMKGKPHAD